ncbi:MAG: ribbon-helix-helix protein, CopG family [Vicinamibacterales bacterium]
MKAIQITVDDRLLARLDADPEVKRLGRSAVFRRAVEAYLSRRRKSTIADAYRRAYGASPGPGDELEGWAGEGVWPEP